MIRALRHPGWLVLPLAMAGCGTAPPIHPASPSEALDAAGALLEQVRADEARAVLLLVDPDELVGEERERYDLLWATALHRTGDSYDGFKVIRNFADEHRFSDLLPRVEELHYEIGASLAQSDAVYFIFGSDREDGEIVLREFAERYGGNPRLPDALRTLGDLAFEDALYDEARRRYEQIAEDHPASEWVPYARFRIAICTFRSLVGPEYDFEQMRRARNELRDYLATEPERPTFRQEAQGCLSTVEDWIQQRYWINSRFYRTVGSEIGERNLLQELIREYPASPTADKARVRLDVLDGKRQADAEETAS
jgi:hypothetical protein